MVFQRPVMLRRSVLANVVYGLMLAGVSPRERELRARDVLEAVGLENIADQPARVLSGGEQQRLALARAWALGPEVLFLDEPTVGLDPVARQTVWARLDELRARGATTMLLTTHDMEEAETLCDRIAILHRGGVQADGTLAELRAQFGEDRLEDIFIRAASGVVETGGDFRAVARERRTAHRVG
jgi:ABC-type multidrug transport system ATPase subunit